MFYKEKYAGGETILIVDDVEINREILGEIIRNMGCRPVLAANGENALEQLRILQMSGEGPPQLILTDVSMPGIDGYELCRILKGNARTRSIPIVLISANDKPQDIVEGFSIGCEDYITKPFIPEEVQARVGVHLRLYEMARELQEKNRRLQVSVGEQLRQMELEKKNILYALAGIAEKNSTYDESYRKRMSANCGILAQGMQLSPLYEERISDTFIDTIELAAPLCDIGNIGVPEEILKKEEAELTEQERILMQGHTGMGAKLLSDLHGSSDYNDFVSISMEIVHYHHENWDGSGYPAGLKGEEIPLAAQIVSLMSRYCTLTAKGNLNRQEALSEMKEEAGIKFNPDIYKICCKISRQLK